MTLCDFLTKAVRNFRPMQTTVQDQRRLIAVVWWTERPVPYYGTKALRPTKSPVLAQR